MHTNNRPFALAACLCLIVCPAALAKPASVAERLAAQNALFEEQYQADLKANPERATSYGDYRYNDRLDDYSLGGIKSEHASDLAFLA